MRKVKLMLVLLGVFCFAACQSSEPQGGKLKMWYDKPAKVWNEALPVGNGRLGAYDLW